MKLSSAAFLIIAIGSFVGANAALSQTHEPGCIGGKPKFDRRHKPRRDRRDKTSRSTKRHSEGTRWRYDFAYA